MATKNMRSQMKMNYEAFGQFGKSKMLVLFWYHDCLGPDNEAINKRKKPRGSHGLVKMSEND